METLCPAGKEGTTSWACCQNSSSREIALELRLAMVMNETGLCRRERSCLGINTDTSTAYRLCSKKLTNQCCCCSKPCCCPLPSSDYSEPRLNRSANNEVLAESRHYGTPAAGRRSALCLGLLCSLPPSLHRRQDRLRFRRITRKWQFGSVFLVWNDFDNSLLLVPFHNGSGEIQETCHQIKEQLGCSFCRFLLRRRLVGLFLFVRHKSI